jgi:ankyrin repeat protein
MNEWFDSGGRFLQPDLQKLERLLGEHKGKLDVDAKDEHGTSSLGYACLKGYGSLAQFLLRHGADPSRPIMTDGTAPLAAAADSGPSFLFSVCAFNRTFSLIDCHWV